MKKTIAFLLSAGLVLSVTGCSGKNPETASGVQGIEETGNQTQEGPGVQADVPQSGSFDAAADVAGTTDGGTESPGGLRILASMDMEGCHTKDGYYYQTFETARLSDGSYGSHLMYMDFAAGQEVYLCSNAGCTHDSPDCTSVLLHDEFHIGGTLLFIWQDSLYLLTKMPDNDGTMFTSFDWADASSRDSDIESSSAQLYRVNLDGTGREKVYTFDASLTLEDLVLGDENGIYVVEKKITAEKSGEDTYYNATERWLACVDVAKGTEQKVCSMDFEGYVSWQLKGCYGRTLVLEGTDYGREVSNEEIFSDDDYYEALYDNSRQVFATFALDHPQLEIKYSYANQYGNCGLVDGNMLYTSVVDGSIRAIDLSSGEVREICRHSGGSYPQRRIGNKLCCSSIYGGNTFDYIDIDTGEISNSPLANISMGSYLEFIAILDTDVLVIYDCDATANGDGSYEINSYQYGLISHEDLFAGNANYRKIKMAGKGI